jgi:hypothetical protein
MPGPGDTAPALPRHGRQIAHGAELPRHPPHLILTFSHFSSTHRLQFTESSVHARHQARSVDAGQDLVFFF